MSSSNVTKEYLYRVKVLLPIYKNAEKEFLMDLSEAVEEFVDANTNATMSDLEERFGTPLEISQSYVNLLDMEELVRRLSVTRLIKKVVAILIILAFLCLSVFSYFTYRGYLESKDAIVVTEETIISD